MLSVHRITQIVYTQADTTESTCSKEVHIQLQKQLLDKIQDLISGFQQKWET